jgi:hypothetical protein
VENPGVVGRFLANEIKLIFTVHIVPLVTVHSERSTVFSFIAIVAWFTISPI